MDSTCEQRALVLGNDREQLRQRLMGAKSCLTHELYEKFKENKFDFDKKAMISDDGKYLLQWRVRYFPNKPESYDNQQTSVGTIVIMENKNDAFVEMATV